MTTSNNHFCFIRVAPLYTKSRGEQSLGKALGHLDKHKKSADTSREELEYLNCRYIENPKKYKDCVLLAKELEAKHNLAVDEWNEKLPYKNELIKKENEFSLEETPLLKSKRHMKSGTQQFFEGVLTFSPDMENQIDIDRWSELSLEFIKKEYQSRGCEILRFDRHGDEHSIHIHFVVACYDNEKDNCTCRNILGGRAELSQLQDRYGDAMYSLGLERGYSRYKAQEAIKNDAAKALGIKRSELTMEQVKQYCVDRGIKYPKRKRHQTLKEYKTQEIKKLDNEYSKKEAELAEIELQQQFAEHDKDSTIQQKEKALTELTELCKKINHIKPFSQCYNTLQALGILLAEENYSTVKKDIGEEDYMELVKVYNNTIKAVNECDTITTGTLSRLMIFGADKDLYANLSQELNEQEYDEQEHDEQQYSDEDR